MTTSRLAHSQPGEGLWDFAIDLYSTPRVADACLALQDRHGCDVNVVLFAAWLGAVRGDRVAGAELGKMVVGIAAWHDAIVRRSA